MKTLIWSTLDTVGFHGIRHRYSEMDQSKRPTTSLKKFRRRPDEDRIFFERAAGDEIVVFVIGIDRYSDTISLKKRRRKRSTSS